MNEKFRDFESDYWVCWYRVENQSEKELKEER